MIDQIRYWQSFVNESPPVPAGILAHMDVPIGQTFRQWDTEGRLWIWMCAFDLPLIKKAPRYLHTDVLAKIGIPIYEIDVHELTPIPERWRR